MTVIAFLQATTAAFLATLAATLAWLMLTRRIGLRGLLRDKQSGRLSPGRIQALVLTCFGGGGYLAAALADPNAGTLPPVPGELLAVLGGSHSLYLAGKLRSLLRGSLALDDHT